VSERITPSYRPRQVEKQAPCQAGCANCGDIRGWIAAVAQRRSMGESREQAYARAWRLITDVNPFPATLGRICPHPCENQCNRGGRDEPLAINAMERFLGDYGLQASLPLPRLRNRKWPEWLGVVGAGPSGLSFAYQMARRGYRVTVYDARKKAGGMLRYGVPDYRLPQEVLDAEVNKILELGVELELSTRVGLHISLDTLRSRHSALYLGIGAQKGRALAVPGGDGPSVWSGTDYLSRINRGETIATGRRVVVVGGGNTAVDAARCARRGGADVTVLYRRSRAEMPAIAHEIDEALEEGIELMLLAAPVALEREADGRLKTLRAQRMELGEPDASGRRRPVPVADSEFSLPVDSVISALSQLPVLEGLESLDHEGDWLVADATGELERDILAGGDALGPGIAGEAIVQGRRAAELLHGRFRGLDLEKTSDPHIPDIGVEQIMFATKPRCEPVQAEPLEPEQRLQAGMAEFTRTIGEEEFLAEVERCYSCGACFGCEQCFMYCTAGCFTRAEDPRGGHYFVLNLENCGECGKCVEVCPCGYLELESP
jgi:formate dehydrogenase major subunit